MKARVLRTNSKTATYGLMITINPIEAEKILDDLHTDPASSHASRTLFRWLVAIADQDAPLINRINAVEDVSEWPLDQVS